jgi:uncharacterized protein (TIGR03067 family)
MGNRYLAAAALVTGLIALTGCLGGGSGGTGPSGYTTELEGTWVYGYTDTLYTYQMTIVFADSNWTITEDYWWDQDTTITRSGTFNLNTSQVPREIDMLCVDSPYSGEEGYTALGIYALNSTATACTIAVNDFGDTVRPSDFYYGWVMNKQ